VTDSERIHGFAPILGSQPGVLILGSMPSVASLEKQQYYGKPQNAFWRIMAELFTFDPLLEYHERAALLANRGVAVWDVLASCVRPGSLDSAIQRASEQPNDFSDFLSRHTTISRVFFNGRKAEEIYTKRVLPELITLPRTISYACLPSTSPAMASLNFAAKLQQWRQVAEAVL